MESVFKKIFIGLVLLHLAALVFLMVTTRKEVYQQRAIPEDLRQFTISEGSSLNQVLEELHQKQLAPTPVIMRLALSLENERVVVKKGEYQLPESSSPRDLLDLFQKGRVVLHKVTIPEGLDRWQVAELLGQTQWGDQETFQSLINDPSLIGHLDPEADSLEGYLFPETYLFPEGTDAFEVVASMVNQFEVRTADLRNQLKTRPLSLRRLVTLASLVEKESSLAEERVLIAGVFSNRLERGMLLQCDPTIIYSLKLDNRYRGKIYRSDIRYNHPYNTYVSKDLPPGPIANPSLGSLQAALFPDETPYLYFVAMKNGAHYFSKSLKEHNRAVRTYQRN